MIRKTSRQSARPVLPIQEYNRGRTERVVHITVSKKQRFIALKYILAKFRYEPEKCSEKDLVVLIEIFEWLVEFSNKGTTYCYNKRGMILKSYYPIIRSIGLFLKGEREAKKIFWTFPKEYARELFTAHQYFGLKNSLFKKDLEVRMVDVKLVKSPERYIGVGYKDKGSSRKFQSEDNTPSWQEVACDSHFRKLYSITYSAEDPPDLGIGRSDLFVTIEDSVILTSRSNGPSQSRII